MSQIEGLELKVPESVYFMLTQLDSNNMLIRGNRIEVEGSIELINPTIISDEQVDDRLYQGMNET